MQNNPFKIFNLDDNASRDQLDYAYQNLKEEYSKKIFYVGEEGAQATRMLTLLQKAYSDCINIINEKELLRDTNNIYTNVTKAVLSGDLSYAQDLLDAFETREAEWHFQQAMVFYKKEWADESRKQLELALTLDPQSTKYKTTLDRLVQAQSSDAFNQNQNQNQNQQPNSNNGANGQNNGGAGQYDRPNQQQNMPPRSSCSCCDMCAGLMCADCLCDCMGGGC